MHGLLILLLSRLVAPIASLEFHGASQEHHLDGRPFTGAAYEFYPSGLPYRLFFVWHGRRTGVERHWYGDGSLWIERAYRNGLPHGEWRSWYAHGAVQSLKHYDNGEAHGEQWAWHPNGQLAEYNRLVRGKDVAHKSWISDGKPFYNYVVRDGQNVGLKGGDFCKRSNVYGPNGG